MSFSIIIGKPRRKLLPAFDRKEPEVRDSSATATSRECLRKYFLAVVQGWRLNRRNIPIEFGVAGHKFREVLQKTDGDLSAATARAMKLWKGDPPISDRYDFLTQGRLFKTCLMAYNRWKLEKETGRIQVAVSEQVFILTMKDGKTKRGGRIDEGILWNGVPWPRDFKFSSKSEAYWNRKLEPNDQFSNYTWAYSKLSGQQAPGVYVEVAHNEKKSEKPKFWKFMAKRTPKQLERWENDQIFWEQSILATCREADTWPMEETQCLYCDFRRVCTRSSATAMAGELEANYTQDWWDFRHMED